MRAAFRSLTATRRPIVIVALAAAATYAVQAVAWPLQGGHDSTNYFRRRDPDGALHGRALRRGDVRDLLRRHPYTVRHPSPRLYALNGIAAAVLVLTRPSGAVVLLFALFPLVIRDRPLRERLLGGGAFLAAAAVLLGGWATYNAIRFDDFTVSRGRGAFIPFYRLWVDHRVKPTNGPASAKLARAVEEDVLTREPYRSSGIDVATFFSTGGGRAFEDVLALSDRRWGWDDDYSVMAAAAREAISREPGGYARDVWQTVREYLVGMAIPYYPTAPAEAQPSEAAPSPPALPPAESARLTGDITERAHFPWLLSGPDPPRTVDRGDGTTTLVWDDADARASYLASGRDAAAAAAKLPDRGFWQPPATLLRTAGSMYPSMFAFLALGLAGVLVRRPPYAAVAIALAAFAAVFVVAVAVGVYTVYEYRIPVDPLFVLFGMVGFLAPGPNTAGTASASAANT